MFNSYTKCQCGAITLYADNGASYSVSAKNRKDLIPRLDLRTIRRYPQTYCCDHCVNHYGLDLCACGSGESPKDCTNGLPECGRPMQELGVRMTHSFFGTRSRTDERSIWA